MTETVTKPRRRPGNAPVVYEVRLTLDPGIRDEFERWLDGHVREMIALPGFFDARIIRADPDAEGRPRRIVRYRVRDRAALDHYFQHDAERMRADGLERFGEGFSAERDVYPAVPAARDTGEQRCPNCGAVAEPRFCPVCGQEQKDVHVSFGRLMLDFLGDAFTFDSRLWRSLRPLLARPGFLTREYFEGRRARYIPPLRLYLFISIIFFGLLAVLLPDDSIGEIENDAARPAVQEQAAESGSVAAQTESAPQRADKRRPDDAAPDEGPGNEDVDINLGVLPFLSPEVKQRLEERARRVAASPIRFTRYLIENLPVAMFLLLPVYALVLRLLYPRAGYVYLEHLIYALHVHAFTFLLLTFQLLMNWAGARFAPDAPLRTFESAISIYLLAYPWIAMRRTYRQGVLMTTLKYLLQAAIYAALLLLALGGAAIVTIYWF